MTHPTVIASRHVYQVALEDGTEFFAKCLENAKNLEAQAQAVAYQEEHGATVYYTEEFESKDGTKRKRPFVKLEEYTKPQRKGRASTKDAIATLQAQGMTAEQILLKLQGLA